MSRQRFDDEHNLPTHMDEGLVFEALADDDSDDVPFVSEWIEARAAKVREAYQLYPSGDEWHCPSQVLRYRHLGWDHVDENGVSHIKHSHRHPFGNTDEEKIRRMYWMGYSQRKISDQTKTTYALIDEVVNHLLDSLEGFQERTDNGHDQYSW